MSKKLIIDRLHNSLHSFEVIIIHTETIDNREWDREFHIDVDTKKGIISKNLSLNNVDTLEKIYIISEMFSIAYRVMKGEVTSRLVLEEQDIYNPFNFNKPCLK